MLSVGVLIDLLWREQAGGHVKCWERLAEAARAFPESLDLTVHLLAEQPRTVELAPNARYVLHRPLAGTHKLKFLHGIADHTDLAPLYPGLIPHLRRHNVIHATDSFFALARTARYYARITGRPLVSSIHTNTPAYTRLYAAKVLGRLRLGRWLLARVDLAERYARGMEKKQARYLAGCDWVLLSAADEAQALAPSLPQQRVSVLRRGIDKQAFHPARRDRARLAREFGIPEDRFMVLFAGRVDDGKSVMTLAQALRGLLDKGMPVHGLFAGEGGRCETIRELLGDAATLPGSLPHRELAWVYASADLFAFPSRIEVFPNVVIEAGAAGLPVLAATQGARLCILEPGVDGWLIDDDLPEVWAAAIAALVRDPERGRRMGQAARQRIESGWPSWEQVLAEDLLPVWSQVCRERAAARRARVLHVA
jgi:glycosyltransferase involved in cell wall biosynthesis